MATQMQPGSGMDGLQQVDITAFRFNTWFKMQTGFKKVRRAKHNADARNLMELKPGESGILDRLDLPEDDARRLMELGFVPGEKIRMLKRGMPGGEPLAIKVGSSTFALRRFEAALVSIQPE